MSKYLLFFTSIIEDDLTPGLGITTFQRMKHPWHPPHYLVLTLRTFIPEPLYSVRLKSPTCLSNVFFE